MSNTAKPCIRCHVRTRVTDLHCQSCADHVAREAKKFEKLMTSNGQPVGERVVLAEPAYSALAHVADLCGWKPEDADLRAWVRVR